ncbi:YTDC2 helicase, partial [Emberiza fucata]|nr:YTDC2 helicase [Emberiza fucata]
RAGRCQPGVCFRLFSRLRFQNMLEFQSPELLRMPLQELCLHTKLLAPINCPIVDFLMKAPDPPPAVTVRNAVHMLKTIDAMDPWEDLTELGYHLTELPVEPHLGKMVLTQLLGQLRASGKEVGKFLIKYSMFKCCFKVKHVEIVTKIMFTGVIFLTLFEIHLYVHIHAGYGVDEEFLTPFENQTQANMALFCLVLLSGFVRARGGADIRDVNTNSENWAVIKAALVAGMYPNLVHVDRESLVLTEPKEKKVRFHPTSVLGQSQYKKIAPANGQAAAIQALPTDWLIYDEMTRAHKTANIRCCSVVTPVTVSLFCGPARLPSNALQASSSFRGGVSNDSSDSEMEDKTTANLALLKLDEWLHLKLDPEVSKKSL